MSGDLTDLYNKLLERSKELAVIGSAGAILSWDMETKMPPGAVELKSQQLAFIQKVSHQRLTDPENGRILDTIEKHPGYEGLTQLQKRNVHLARKAYDENTRLPEELVVEIARHQTIAVNTWKRAKAAKDYSMFKPDLEKMIGLQMRQAELLMPVKGAKTPYDALIDNFEPRMTADTITGLFDEMKKGLKKVLDKVAVEPKPETGFLHRSVPVAAQEKIADTLAQFIGYDTKSDKASGRIDPTEHPFTTGYYTDVRVTTHYHKDLFTSNLFSVLHEGGHALYELGLPRDWMYQPVGSSTSYGVHESMSRFVENYVGRSSEFWEYYLPVLKKLTGKTLKDMSLDQIVRAVNYVTPSKIRIEADEVTYGLHIVIRFEMERDIFTGKLNVDELPEAWNQKYRDYLGVEVEHDSEGVMQDTHWASGYFGYFPSYALGNLYDGIWTQKLAKDVPDWRTKIGEGSFKEVKDWLTENVYRYGNLYDPEDLVKQVTRKPLQVKPFVNYLDKKFRGVYGY